MKKSICLFVVSAFFFAGSVTVQAAEKKGLNLSNDITKETIVGPGSVTVVTGKDVMMSFGALIRFVPTAESNWDFGMSDNVPAYLGGAFSNNLYKDHKTEAGWVNNSYIRNESKIYFNAMPEDKKWSFYAALEYDSILENSSVDARGGKDDGSSNFGLERLHTTMALPGNMRIHAGWDVWELDAINGGGLIYGDDNPGLWLTGDYDTMGFNIGYFKLEENDFQVTPATLNDESQDDRDLFAGSFTIKPSKENKVDLLYAFDRIRNVSVKDMPGAMTQGAMGIVTGATPVTDSHHLGAVYNGKFGNFEIMTEGVYQFGEAEDTGFAQDDFDINAYAFAADFALEFEGLLTGFPLRPHLGILYTTGDDDASDDKLEGYTGVTNAQRFSKPWGGENTIAGDTNFVLGTLLYGYLPELHGNGTPVFTGGLQNGTDLGGGRGDNPGLMMVSTGFTVAPKKFLIYKTNVNMFHWNEDFSVANMVNPMLGYSVVEAGYAGTEWDNELTLALSKNTFIRGQASVFFPGDGVKDVTQAISGVKADEKATRVATELIWKF